MRTGSAWAVAALAYGTETIPRVDVIVGPGNRYVTLAKKIVAGTQKHKEALKLTDAEVADLAAYMAAGK